MIRASVFASLWLFMGWNGLALAQTSTVTVGNAHIDPQTNQLSAPAQPPALQLTPDEQNQMSTAHDGLREQALPEGGYQLDLQGRFQYSMFATVAPNGQIQVNHNTPGLEHDHAHP